MGNIYKSLIISPNKNKSLTVLNPGYLVIDSKGVILEVSKEDPRNKFKSFQYYDYSKCLILPGFIDTHTHLPQYSFVGLGGSEELLPWLENYTFPEEDKFKSNETSRERSRIFFRDAIRNGTTCIAAYATIHKNACDIAFEEAGKSKIRAIIGKVMMNQNSPKYLIEKTEDSINTSLELAEKWNGFNDRLYYALTPRFAVTCSIELLKKTAEAAQKNNLYIQSHLSESKNEIVFIKKIYPKYKSYTDVYYQTGILGPKTIMAHCIYLDEDEVNMIKDTKTKVVHCPTSNRFIKSGVMPLRKYLNNNLTVGLGTDVAGGYSLSMFNEMKETTEMSKILEVYTEKSNTTITPSEAFYLATLGGAETLSLEKEIGSLEKGKKGDFLIIDYRKSDPLNGKSEFNKPDEILSRIIYRGSCSIVKHVFINGEEINTS
jgi:guanine deaminase